MSNRLNDDDNKKNQCDSESSSVVSEPETRTRVGDDYQAITNLIESSNKDTGYKEMLVWTPSEKLTDSQIEEYLFAAKARYGYSIEQALAMLFWHNHDIEKALSDMTAVVPVPDEWSYEDKILFEQAFLYYGKNFNKIRIVLPEKSQASLVNYYYMWKKTRNYKSLIDNLQTKNEIDKDDDDNGVDYGAVNPTNICCNCDDITNEIQSTPKGMLCKLCYNYWRGTGVMRPENLNCYPPKIINAKYYNADPTVYIQNINNDAKAKETRSILKSFRRPPKGVYLNLEELNDLTQPHQTQIFERLDNRIMSLKRQIQSNKQEMSLLTNKLIDIDKLISTNIFDLQSKVNKINNSQTPKVTSLWTQREAELAIQGFNKYGKDFNAISQIIESKNDETIEGFYKFHHQYSNLDDIIGNNKKINLNINELKSKAKFLLKDKLMTKQQDTEMIIHNDDSSNEDVILL